LIANDLDASETIDSHAQLAQAIVSAAEASAQLAQVIVGKRQK
jgi:hypothetical protein